jgi:hypothetical protein
VSGDRTDDRTDDRYRRYLLGGLPEQERDALEEEYFSSEAGLDELAAAEGDLFDAYAEGSLTPDDRAHFEARHLDAREGPWRVTFARALKRAGREHLAGAGLGTPSATRWPWLGWAAGLAAAAAAAVLFVSLTQARRELGQARAEREALQRAAGEQLRRIEEQGRGLAALREEVEHLRARAQELEALGAGSGRALRAITLVLTAGTRRGPDPIPRVALGPDVGRVRLNLLLPADSRGPYRVTVRTPEGRAVWAGSGLRAASVEGGSAVVASMPASALSAGHYLVAVAREGGPAEPLAEYAFRASRP